MGFTTGDVPTPRVSALMRLKTQNCPQMSVRTAPHPTHTHTHAPYLIVNDCEPSYNNIK